MADDSPIGYIFERAIEGNSLVDSTDNKQAMKTKKVKRRVRKRTTIDKPHVKRSSSPYYDALLDVAKGIDAEFIRALLRQAQSRGFDIGSVDDYLIEFNWEAALRLLPFLMEYAETLSSADGAEKERQTLALLLRIAELAGVDAMFDEHAVATLRIVIEKLAEVLKGEYRINLGRLARFVKSLAAWSLRHCACMRGNN
jgi:hypothetical protein